jgi:hypothetical protein
MSINLKSVTRRIGAGTIGRSAESVDEHAAMRARLREQRVLSARGSRRWTEIPETRLVPRGPWLCDAQTDALYTVSRGAVFGPAGGIEFDEMVDRQFFVSPMGDVVMLERVQTPATWSEYFERQARRKVAAS